MKLKTKAVHSWADFSDCKKYRYSLIRHFEKGEGIINFIMLNPSTADHQFNDPTVARCEDWAIRLGYKRLVITNLFALRSTDPKELKKNDDPVGPQNDSYLLNYAVMSDCVICAWGNHGKHLGRSKFIKDMLPCATDEITYLKMNKSGEPSHPLYLPKKLEPIEWDL